MHDVISVSGMGSTGMVKDRLHACTPRGYKSAILYRT